MASHRMVAALGALTLLTWLSGCGWYTNVPAQLHVASIDPSTVSVVFNGTNPPQFTNPTVTLAGEPGSIGADLSDAAISYTDPSKTGNASAITALNMPGQGIGLRVEAAYLKSYGTTGNTSTNPEFVAGTGKAVLPIVNQRVLDYAKQGDPKPGSVTAYVVLKGLDDAHLPAQVAFFVPVVFSGQ